MKNTVLILGANGMLGHTLFKTISRMGNVFQCMGTIRDEKSEFFSAMERKSVISDVNVLNFKELENTIRRISPDVIINCTGIIKQKAEAKDPILSIEINSLLPHKLAKIAEEVNARLICISTDCVFDGKKGYYTEDDMASPTDLYGRTKLLGEISEKSHCITLRTSIIGHELKSKYGLLDWFLSQEKTVNGFKNAYFSGFTTMEFSKIIVNHILPSPKLCGLWHVASEPVSKYNLLKIVAQVYKRDIEILPFEKFECNRILLAEKFNKATGYTPPLWIEMIKELYKHYKNENISK